MSLRVKVQSAAFHCSEWFDLITNSLTALCINTSCKWWNGLGYCKRPVADQQGRTLNSARTTLLWQMLLGTVADPVGSEHADWLPTLSSAFLGKMIAKAGTGLTHILLIAGFKVWIFERKLLRKIGRWNSLAFTPWISRGCGGVAALPEKQMVELCTNRY